MATIRRIDTTHVTLLVQDLGFANARAEDIEPIRPRSK
jgi:hypothetical protein